MTEKKNENHLKEDHASVGKLGELAPKKPSKPPTKEKPNQKN